MKRIKTIRIIITITRSKKNKKITTMITIRIKIVEITIAIIMAK